MGQCLPAGSFLCLDGSATGNQNYVCTAGTTCGRGVCVPSGSILCGTSGTTACSAGTTCCGVTAQTKDTDMTCADAGTICPLDRQSTTTYTAQPYVYTPSTGGVVTDTPGSALTDDGSGGASMGTIGGVAGAVVLVIAVALVVIFVAKKKKSNDHSSVNVTNAAVQMTNSAAETSMAPIVAAGEVVPSYAPEPAGNFTTIEFDSATSLGFGLKEEDGATIVSSVEKGSSAHEVPLGTKIIGVHGQSTAGKSKKEVLQMIVAAKKAEPKLRITFDLEEQEQSFL